MIHKTNKFQVCTERFVKVHIEMVSYKIFNLPDGIAFLVENKIRTIGR